MQASHEYLRCTQLVEINFEVVEGVSKISRLTNGRFTTISSHTANIFNVIFIVFMCVPYFNVIPLYGLHLITAPSTVEKCKD